MEDGQDYGIADETGGAVNVFNLRDLLTSGIWTLVHKTTTGSTTTNNTSTAAHSDGLDYLIHRDVDAPDTNKLV